MPEYFEELVAYTERVAALTDDEIMGFPDLEPDETPAGMYRKVLRELGLAMITERDACVAGTRSSVLEAFQKRCDRMAEDHRHRAETSTVSSDRVTNNIKAATLDAESQYVTRLLRDNVKLRSFVTDTDTE